MLPGSSDDFSMSLELPLGAAAVPGASAEEAEGAGGSENGDLRPLGGRPSAPGLQRAGRPGPAVTPALTFSSCSSRKLRGWATILRPGKF